ncbi:cytochrome c biogenesis CcdA family protein [Ignavigranum ruoffiae]|uniref:Cytochrome c-type biogenesis protein n=1 Tax=Ignavigranum ruoffiae TaxID=89093 RepID=A0A1H9DAL9_9LACT|nr:cytochrome c biogenesis CcdA family protein [Ignavigranum ruoffiae]UPQ86219.1 cytochrome c biogenesis CcdA family protein [Ignavigranum ruoffiae]SEQ10401.1 cytochrome c-type biogenesis protein [Ignavigranum ruoffiae]
MVYWLIFLEGILTFISPCMLPMIPLYLAYFGAQGETKSQRQFMGQVFLFIIGFSLVFILMNGLLYSLASWLLPYQSWLNFFAGLWMILIGLSILFPTRLLKSKGLASLTSWLDTSTNSFLFGLVFALSWTPCVGAYLAAALSLSLTADHLGQSMLMMGLFCMGLALPFVLSAYLVQSIKDLLAPFKAISHRIYQLAGLVLIVMGLLWMSGYLSAWISL